MTEGNKSPKTPNCTGKTLAEENKNKEIVITSSRIPKETRKEVSDATNKEGRKPKNKKRGRAQTRKRKNQIPEQ